MNGWGFYGRGQELDWLRRRLGLHKTMESRDFRCYRITGRRSVGKSTLMERVMRGATDGTPHVYLEIDEDWTGAREALSGMVDEIRARGYVPLFAGREYLLTDPDSPEFKSVPYTYRPQKIFADIVEHLIRQGAVVTIDEFHRAPALRVSSKLRKVVDGFRKGRRYQGPGKLVLTGSHEQMMKEMFGRSREWFGRCDAGLDLKQWPPRTVLGMVAEYGLLERPDRFLTLWTAYGGMPGLWERFMTEGDRLDECLEEPDDNSWRRKFIAAEAAILSGDSDERFDAAAYVRFDPWVRDALLVMGRTPARPLDAKTIVREIVESLDMDAASDGLTPHVLDVELGRLRLRMGTVRRVREFLAESKTRSPDRWIIDDRNALFQLNVFADLHLSDWTDPNPRPGGISADLADLRLARLIDLEGRALESLAAEWIWGLDGTRWTESGSWRGEFREDIDVTALTGPGERCHLLLGSCKRAAREFKPDKDNETFRNLMRAVDRKRWHAVGWENLPQGPAERWLDRPDAVRRVAFCTEVGPARRDSLALKGFETIDILDMAATHGYGPRATKEPEPFRASDPFVKCPTEDFRRNLRNEATDFPPRPVLKPVSAAEAEIAVWETFIDAGVSGDLAKSVILAVRGMDRDGRGLARRGGDRIEIRSEETWAQKAVRLAAELEALPDRGTRVENVVSPWSEITAEWADRMRERYGDTEHREADLSGHGRNLS